MTFGGFPRGLVEFLSALRGNNQRDRRSARMCMRSRERPGYFVRLTPEDLTIGAGMHVFASRAILEKPGLQQATDTVPPDFEVHRARRLYAERTEPLHELTFTSGFPTYVSTEFNKLRPLQLWLVDALAS